MKNEIKKMDKFDRVQLLEQAGDKIQEAVALIEEAVKDTSEESSADAYIIAHLNNWANGDNPYDQSIPKLIKAIEDEEVSEDEDFEKDCEVEEAE